jgi:hypothetical protein
LIDLDQGDATSTLMNTCVSNFTPSTFISSQERGAHFETYIDTIEENKFSYKTINEEMTLESRRNSVTHNL